MAFAYALCYNNRKAVMYIYGTTSRPCGATDVDAKQHSLWQCYDNRKAAGIIVDLGGFSCQLHGQPKRIACDNSVVLWCDTSHTEHRISPTV